MADLPARDLVAATPAGVRNKPGDPEDNANPARLSATVLLYMYIQQDH